MQYNIKKVNINEEECMKRTKMRIRRSSRPIKKIMVINTNRFQWIQG